VHPHPCVSFAGAVHAIAGGIPADAQMQQLTASSSDSRTQQAQEAQDISIGQQPLDVGNALLQAQQDGDGQASQQDGQQGPQQLGDQQQEQLHQEQQEQQQHEQQQQQHLEHPISLKVFLGHVPAEHAGCRWV
jgi:hypothetical protein